MTDSSTTKVPPLERRFHTRHRARTKLKIVHGNKSLFTEAVNLSANGVFAKTEGMMLKKGTKVQLIFVINLGTVQKLHRRDVIVAHVTNGGTGFLMQSLTAPAPKA